MTCMSPQLETETCPFCGLAYKWINGGTCTVCGRRACLACLSHHEPARCPECDDSGMPRHVESMLARSATLPRKTDEWYFEYKWDGERATCHWDGRHLRLESRNLLDISSTYPELEEIAAALGNRACILDGEVVALDAFGRPSFSALQDRIYGRRPADSDCQVSFLAFDVLFHDGESALGEPYDRRRELLRSMQIAHPRLRVPPSQAIRGRAMLRAAEEHGLEGIVCKRATSVYQPGRRSNDWRKVKVVRSQDFVIGGWTPAPGNRIGALLLGYYDENQSLTYAGEVDIGLRDDDQEILRPRLQSLAEDRAPFARRVPEMEAAFVSPQLVVEVTYRRWPEHGELEQAAYKGLRRDKDACDVIREERGL